MTFRYALQLFSNPQVTSLVCYVINKSNIDITVLIKTECNAFVVCKVCPRCYCFYVVCFILQDAFHEEGLSRLWNELTQDGEMATAGISNKDKREETPAHSVSSRRSPFTQYLQEWTWGQVSKHTWLDTHTHTQS